MYPPPPTCSSGGVGGPAGLALAGALLDGVMNLNIELLMAQQDRPTLCVIMPYYALLRTYDIRGSDRNGSS